MNVHHKIITLIIFFWIFLICGLAQAQQEVYRIGPRDIITLTIHAGGELQNHLDLTVSDKGTINVPYIGSVRAAGYSISKLEDLITKPLAQDYFVDPEINISVKEYHSLRYFIAGAVKSPGLYEMTFRANLLELITKAGGVLPTRGNIAYILDKSKSQVDNEQDIDSLISRNEPIKVDLKKLLDQGDMSQNRQLEPGDLVYIPLEKSLNLSESKVYVGGEVKNPGVLTYQPGLTALYACIMAGGFTKFAAPNRTKIIRYDGGKKIIIKINLNDVKKGSIPDVEIKPGDLIHVPETWL